MRYDMTTFYKGQVLNPGTPEHAMTAGRQSRHNHYTASSFGGAGVVYDYDGRGNLGQNTYQARRIAACTVRRFDTTPGTKLVTGAELAARRPSRSNGWAR